MGLATSPIRHYIQEWQPPNWHDASFLYGALPIALAIVAGGAATLTRDKKRSSRRSLLFLAALFAFRNTALFAIVAAPLAARGLDARFPRIGALGREGARARAGGAFPTIALAIGFAAFAMVKAQSHLTVPPPLAAIERLAADGAPHRLFCENFTWCSAALQHPTLRVFIDGRCDAYPLPVWRRYVATIQTRPAWSSDLSRYGVDAVIAGRGGAIGVCAGVVAALGTHVS